MLLQSSFIEGRPALPAKFAILLVYFADHRLFSVCFMSISSGNVFMVVAPSGAGKSTLVNALLERDSALTLSLSCTTRAPRPGEEDGREYRFVSLETFAQLRDRHALLEWAEVHGNFYGTPTDHIEQSIGNGHDVLLEIDWQGARQIRQRFPAAVGIFILPPSFDALETRLKARGQDDASVIARRLLGAGGEIAHAPECEYVIINQEFSVALQELTQIISAARLRFSSQAARHANLFSQLGIPAAH
jgi:guanylate kinase